MMVDDFEEEGKGQSDEFARLLEDSFRKKAKRYAAGDKLQAEILVIGKDEVFVATGATSDGIVLRRDLVNEKGEFPYKVGDRLDLFVTHVKGSEVFLSPKPTAKNLAEDLEDAFDLMLPVEGRVVEVCKGGFRVSVKGQLAFCPISQIDAKRVETPEEYVGQRFDFRITQFSEGGRNIVVSRRRLLEEERELNAGSFSDEHKVGDVVRGRVSRLEKFGAFIELAPGIDGLAHISELSWSRVGDPKEVLQVGQEISCKILKIEDAGGRIRISLSVKQAGAEPWDLVPQKFPVGTVISGLVERREPYGIFVKLDEGITGLLPKSRAQEHPEFPYEKLKVGDTATVQVAEVRREERRISLGIPRDPGSEDWKSFAGSKTGGSFGTLGDQLKAALEKKKKS